MADVVQSDRPVGMRWRAVAAGFVLIVAAMIIYAPVVQRGTWLWDDPAELAQNPEVAGPGGVIAIWISPAHTDYFPLKTTVQWIAWRLWGPDAHAFHLLNVLLHGLSGILVWRLFSRLGIRGGWLGGLLFIVHPLGVESVAWIAELKNTLSLPPLLLAAIAYIDFTETGRRGRQLAALGWFTASLLCKTSGVMLPVVFLLFHFWRSRRLTIGNVVATAPFFLVALVLGLVTIHFQQARAIAETPLPIGNLASRLGIAGLALWFYAGKFVLPLPLVPIYPAWSAASRGVIDLVPWLMAAGVVGVCWWRRAGWGRHVLFGAGSFAILVAPVLGLVRMSYMQHSWVADHFVYLPMIGLMGLGVAGIDVLHGRMRSPIAWRGLAAAIALVLLLASRRHAEIFVDERALWTYTLRFNPQSWAAHDGLGRVLEADGKFGPAMAEFEAAIACNPRVPSPRNNLAHALLASGRPADAIAPLQAALALDPKFVAARTNLGNALLRLGRVDDAVTEFREALRISPRLAEARNNLGNALFILGRKDEAIRELQRATVDQPGFADAHDNLGKILMRTGRMDAALESYARAVALAPTTAAFQYNFGSALAMAGRTGEAETHLREAIRLKPDFADAHGNLAGVLFQRGDLDGAAAEYEAALRLDPKAEDVRQNLEIVRGERERRRAGAPPR